MEQLCSLALMLMGVLRDFESFLASTLQSCVAQDP